MLIVYLLLLLKHLLVQTVSPYKGKRKFMEFKVWLGDLNHISMKEKQVEMKSLDSNHSNETVIL